MLLMIPNMRAAELAEISGWAFLQSRGEIYVQL